MIRVPLSSPLPHPHVRPLSLQPSPFPLFFLTDPIVLILPLPSSLLFFASLLPLVCTSHTVCDLFRLSDDSIPLYRYILYTLDEREREMRELQQQQMRARGRQTPGAYNPETEWQIDNLRKGRYRK